MKARVANGQADGLKQLVKTIRNSQSTSGARIIAITSGKGGVGKTNLAVNLGLCLVQLGKRVVVLDADMGLANVDIVLGRVPKYTLSHVLSGEKQLEEILMEGPGGLMVLAGGSGAEELANISQWKLNRFINSLRVLDDLFDIVLIDTGAGISPHVLGFVLSAQEVMVVTTPDPTAITDAYTVIKMIASKDTGIRIGLLVNMVEGANQAEAVYDKLRLVVHRFLGVSVEPLGSIPNEASVRDAVRQQRPYVLAYPNSQSTRAVKRLAALVLGVEPEQPGGVRQLFHRMANLLR